MSDLIGRASQLQGFQEVSTLEPGLDFRLPEYRRAVFMRFYLWSVNYRVHPGGVYFLMPYLAKRYEMSMEDKLWYAYINGNTQHPITSWLIYSKFPTPEVFVKDHKGASWFDDNWTRLGWDMDRRYQKKEFPTNIFWYNKWIDVDQHYSFMNMILEDDESQAFQKLWKEIRENFPSFGRLSAFSYLEYLRIMGLPQDCDNLFLEDLEGSKSHRNGLAIVLGRDDLDWHGDNNVKYAPGQIDWLKEEAAILLQEAKEKFPDKDVSYYTLESALCTYKSWHRKNRRYPGCYMDMMHDRIKWMEQRWPEEDFSMFWDARKEYLPWYLRQEDSPGDPGMCPEKQNHYLNTGNPVMMSWDFTEFQNEFDERIDSAYSNSMREMATPSS